MLFTVVYSEPRQMYEQLRHVPRYRRTLSCLILLMFCIWAGPSFSASIFKAADDPRCDFNLEGEIEVGDAIELSAKLKPSANGQVLCLNSPGGELREGIALFYAIWNKASIVTRVRSGDVCASACAIAFMGGSRKVGTGAIRSRQSVVEPGASLAFHAPRLQIPEADRYSSTAVQAAYAMAVESMDLLLGITQIEEHDVVGITPFLLREALRTPPWELYEINTIGRASLAEIGIAEAVLPALTWARLRHVCDTAIIKSRKDLQAFGAEVAFSQFGENGTDGVGDPIAFQDRSWSWSDSSFMHFVLRGYPAPHRAERFCKATLSKFAWESYRLSRPNPRLPNVGGFRVVLWNDVDVPQDATFATYAENSERVGERIYVPWTALYDPAMLIADLQR